MKKILITLALFAGMTAIAHERTEVNEKILKAFKETFTVAEDISWHEYDEYVQANFRQQEIQVRAAYNASGDLIRTTRYYKEQHLLPNIVAKLKKKYAGKEIFGVTEVTSDEGVDFVINLKDDKNWYVVNSDIYGNLSLSNKFKRGDKE